MINECGSRVFHGNKTGPRFLKGTNLERVSVPVPVYYSATVRNDGIHHARRRGWRLLDLCPLISRLYFGVIGNILGGIQGARIKNTRAEYRAEGQQKEYV
ncbi:hypothetical protein [Desulfosudis oleivorans]|uniref:hypothetical protein n=1 Tax=Desulfosudis oleivorans TaxID=181663 RepID=UPI001427EBBA|nr:hypothetical protein [Desulfosudis oleivorans]